MCVCLRRDVKLSMLVCATALELLLLFALFQMHTSRLEIPFYVKNEADFLKKYTERSHHRLVLERQVNMTSCFTISYDQCVMRVTQIVFGYPIYAANIFRTS